MTLSVVSTPHAQRRRLTARVISVSVAPVRREPDDASEQVTQALMGAPAQVVETASKSWARVRLADYEGWVEQSHLGAPPQKKECVAVVAAPRAPLFARANGVATRGEVFATTVLPLGDDAEQTGGKRARVALPGGRYGWLERSAFVARPASDPFPARGVPAALELARELLGAPYLWGGVTAQGIDCSGFAQLACREGGAPIPRDADQQYHALPYVVDRDSVRAGDLVYFASRGRITHVGIALDNVWLLHANDFTHSVVISSLDPSNSDYSALLAGMYAGARRPFVGASDARAQK